MLISLAYTAKLPVDNRSTLVNKNLVVNFTVASPLKRQHRQLKSNLLKMGKQHTMTLLNNLTD